MIRILSALVLAVVLVAVIWYLPPIGFYSLLTIAAFLSLVELTRLFFQDPLEKCGTIFASLGLLIMMMFARDSVLMTLPLFLFFLSLLFMWRTRELLGVANRLGISCFALLALGISFAFWVDLREAGPEWVLLVLTPACLTDTMGLLVGKTLGKHRFAPAVSPNKTWEGFFGALTGSLAGVTIIWWLFLQFSHSLGETLGLGLLIWIASPLGDLVESMLKRSVGVKDSGHLIPGHGGMLDRVDALLFAAPISLFYLTLVVGVLP